MPLVRAMRLLNALESGATNAAALEALLADAGRKADLQELLSMRAMRQRISVASTTVAAIGGSAAAMELLLGTPDARADLLTNPFFLRNAAVLPTAMDRIYASPDGMATISPNAWGVYGPHASLFTLTGTSVDAWRSAVGPVSRAMAQVTGSARPVFNAVDGVGGYKTLLFDGADDLLVTADSFAATSVYTAFIVYRRASATKHGLLSWGGTYGVFANGTGGMSAVTGSGTTAFGSAGGSGAWSIARIRCDASGAGFNSHNGGLESTVASTYVQSPSALVPNLGYADNARLTGRVAELWLIANNADPTSAEIARVNALLKAKYGL